MKIRIMDPADCPNWDSLILSNTNHTFFHASAWAKTLSSSYGFKPFYLADINGDNHALLMPLMEVRSRLTGTRGVSLPFTDQCRSLVHEEGLFAHAVRKAIRLGKERRWRYIEWRDSGFISDRLPASELFYVHDIALSRSEEELFLSLSDNNRRNIKKAGRENVVVRIEQTLTAIEGFYRLNLMTRKRHGLPPQPISFFRSVFDHILSKNYGIVVTAYYNGTAIAASVYFHFGKKAIYKYGASETEHLHLRPNNLVMWEALRWYNSMGYETLNLGRTEMNNPGLLQFKRTWGAKECLIKYHLYDIKRQKFVSMRPRTGARFEKLFSRSPTSFLRLIGRIFYKHAG